jgi:uncharacterized protein YndB with AHSA1/START domain
MTELSRSVEISRPPEIVWEVMDMRRWPEISRIFDEVSTDAAALTTGTMLTIIAGPGEEKVRYTAEITAYEAPRRLSYRRSGGPLPGSSDWHLTPTARGTMITYANKYDHDLELPAQASICRAMERFLEELQRVAQEE